MWLTVVALLWLSPSFPHAGVAQAAVVRGIVTDEKTSAPLEGARVLLVEASRSTLTGADGRFEFTNVAPGRHTIAISFIGYIYVRRPIDVAEGATLEIAVPLAEGTGTYRETVTVNASATPPPLGVSSQSELGSAALQDLRGVLADDPMRAVQALPGVATGDDFQAQFSVRGSSFRHVGVVTDGTATPLLVHTVQGVQDTGSVGMINSDILEHASLLAGAHPQRDGDWLGATLDFDVREGSRDRAQTRIAVSGTSASAVFEGPIGWNKRGSWLVSLRKSYLDWLIRKLEPDVTSTIGFTDIQSKLGYDLTARQHVQVLFIGGRAAYDEPGASFANGLYHATSRSGLLSASWRYTRSAMVLTQRVSLASTKFNDRGVIDQQLGSGYARSISWRGDFGTFLPHGWMLEAGARTDRQRDFRVARIFQQIPQSQVRTRFQQYTEGFTTVFSGWAQLSRRSASGGVGIGARETGDSQSGRHVASPWLLAERSLGPWTFKAGAGVSHQFPGLELAPNATGRRPEQALSLDAGVEHQIGHGVRWQLTAFNRRDRDVTRVLGEPHLLDGARLPEATFPSFANRLDGRSRGAELVISRRATTGLTGWIGYAYAHTRYTDSFTGETFDGDFDQRHTLNVFAQQRLSYRTTVSAKLRIGSNFPLVGYFTGPLDALKLGTVRNAVRLPTYARLDVRANRTFTFTRSRITLFAEVMNALGRTNYGQSDGSIRNTLEAVNYLERLIPRVPSVGMLIEF